jgi:leucyl aminopeptidase
MKIHVKKEHFSRFPAEAAIVAQFENLSFLEGSLKLIDEAGGGMIRDVLDNGDFKGKLFETVVLYPDKTFPIQRIILLGLGKQEEFNLERLRGAYAAAAKQARKLNVQKISTTPDIGQVAYSTASITQAIVEGFFLSLYQFERFKTTSHEKSNTIERLTIVDPRDNIFNDLKSSAKKAEIVARVVCFVRDLVSMPANEMTPADMANQAMKIGKNKNVNVKILSPAIMKKLGMNALLGVAQGSKEPAKFIIMEYRGTKASEPFIVLVGKGLTFDSGGISIKPAAKMDEMKSDMAGGAAVMGAVIAASELKLKINVVALIPATENLPGGGAYKPGDIIRSLSGQTIEILSTDAEGRLILADALTYAHQYAPAAIIDVATLTGACVIALGNHVIGMMGNNEKLKKKIESAGESTGERVWELPLWDDYHELIKSDIADLKNTGGRAGGAITAAAFLSNFVGDIPWVHLDIAGPAWLTQDKFYTPKGASGIGVRLLTYFLQDWRH